MDEPRDERPLTVGNHFDAQYDEYLKFAHQHECVVGVHADTEVRGIFVSSHDALM